MSAAAAVKLVLPERIPKEEPLPAVRRVQRCTPALEAIHAPAARQQEPAPGLTADRLRRQGRQAQEARAILAEQQLPARQTVRGVMAGAVPVALPPLHNVKYVLKEVLWEDTATVLPEVLLTGEAAAAQAALSRIPTTARQGCSPENAAETVRIVTAAIPVIADNYFYKQKQPLKRGCFFILIQYFFYLLCRAQQIGYLRNPFGNPNRNIWNIQRNNMLHQFKQNR